MSTDFIGTQDNLREIFESQSEHFDFYILPNCYDIGITNPGQSLENLAIIVERAKQALKNGFVIEFISLKLQYLEFFLRIYYVKNNATGTVISPENKSTFGVIIKYCEQVGFDHTLIDKLKEFNSYRIKAIHKFLLGDTNEEEIKQVCIRHSTLGNEIKDYVISRVGVKIEFKENLPDMLGSMLFQISK